MVRIAIWIKGNEDNNPEIFEDGYINKKDRIVEIAKSGKEKFEYVYYPFENLIRIEENP